MKKILLLPLAVIFVSCTGHVKEEEPEKDIQVYKYDTIAIGAKTYFMQHLEDTAYAFSNLDYSETDSAALINNPDAYRLGDTLTLKCSNGKQVHLVNNASEDEKYRMYQFLELNPDIGYYVVQCSYFESGSFKLINKATGDFMEVPGKPVASPDKKHFACGHCDIIAQYDVSGLAIYKKGNSSYELEGAREISNWGPERMMWKNDTTLIVQGLELKDKNPNPVKIYKAIFIK